MHCMSSAFMTGLTPSGNPGVLLCYAAKVFQITRGLSNVITGTR